MGWNLLFVACLLAFAGLLAVSRPRGGESPNFLQNGLVEILYPVFLLVLLAAGVGGLLHNFN